MRDDEELTMIICMGVVVAVGFACIIIYVRHVVAHG